jgi:DNA repair exonuclease SbcCD ATPase subunit
MSDDRLELLRELERADEAVAAELTEVDELYAAVEELRGRALELEDQLAALPERRAAAAEAVRAADLGVADARAAAERAAAELAQAGEEQLADARRHELAARDSLHVVERLAAAARGQEAELEERAQAAAGEIRTLETRAADLAEALARRPRLAGEAVGEPAPGTVGVSEWGTRARAALLVARSQLAAERDAIVRQAHELAAVVLGEPLPPLGAREVVRHVEEQLAPR